jgi:hypothetical protein
MSNIKITDKTKAKPSVDLKVGQYYRDRTTGDVFILATHSASSSLSNSEYSLICLRDGAPYSSYAARDIIGAFSNDEEDFDLIDNVEIVLS